MANANVLAVLVACVLACHVATSSPCDTAQQQRNLAAAVQQCDIAVLRSMLQAGVVNVNRYFNLDAGNSGRNGTALHAAAGLADDRVVLLLLTHGADVNARDNRRDTPLHYAAANNRRPVMLTLLQNGADANAVDSLGSTPLHHAALHGHDSAALLLLQAGSNANAKDTNGNTPLLHAALGGADPVALVLLQNGAQANAKDSGGYTPLHYAAYYGHVDIVSALLQHGADVNAKNSEGETPLLFALSFQLDNDANTVVPLLLQHGATANAKDSNGVTPLHHAASNGEEFVVAALLQHGADVNAKDNGGYTPLHCAAKYDATGSVVRRLLQHNALVNVLTSKNDPNFPSWTPLHFAADRGSSTVARLLVEAGADASIRTATGETALSIAQRRGRSGVVDALKTSLAASSRPLSS